MESKMQTRQLDGLGRFLRLSGMVAVLAGLGLLPVHADDLVKEQTNSDITVTKDAKGYHVNAVTRRYAYNSFVTATVAPTTTAPTVRQILLIESTAALTEADNEDAEHAPGQVKLTAFPLTAQGQGPAQFTIAAQGDEIDPDGAYVTVTRYGCCVQNETKAVYSLENGKYLFNTTGRKWTTLGAKGGFAMTRIAVAHVAPSAMDDVLFGGEPHAGAILSYASPTAPLQRIMVILPPDAADDTTVNWDGELLWISAENPKGTDHIYVDRTDKAENVFTAATLRFRLDETSVIDIPLRKDRLDIAAAKLPRGYKLKEMPLP
jgi:hypothetical protein